MSIIDRGVRAVQGWLKIVIAAAGLIVVAAVAAIAQSGSDTPIADTYVDSSRPDRAFGDENKIWVDGTPEIRGLLRFGTLRATLTMTVTNPSATAGDLYGVVGSWDESTTWNDAPALGSFIATIPGPAIVGDTVTVDVTDAVKAGITDFYVVSSAFNGVFYASRESANPPILTVELIPPDPPPRGIVMVAAGDIACDPESSQWNGGAGTSGSCAQQRTADLIADISPDVVAVLGDSQYENGDIDKYYASYDISWGLWKSITNPSVGNHEYMDNPPADGFGEYWGAQAGPPNKFWYSYDVGDWHVVVLNSADPSVAVGSEQYDWLVADLAADASSCTVAYWHHPRWSNGQHGDTSAMVDIYDAAVAGGVDLVLAANDHTYERLLDGNVRNFVVGTGGRNIRSGTVTPSAMTEAYWDETGGFGVLSLDLYDGGYDWKFVPTIPGAFADAGSATCDN